MLVARGKDAKHVFVIIDDETYERMEKGDPFDLPLRSVDIDSDVTIVVGRVSSKFIANSETLEEVFRHAIRGYERKPEDEHAPIKIGTLGVEND